MRAVVCRELGPPEKLVIEEREDLEPADALEAPPTGQHEIVGHRDALRQKDVLRAEQRGRRWIRHVHRPDAALGMVGEAAGEPRPGIRHGDTEGGTIRRQ